MNEPTYTLQVPRSVAMMCAALMRKLPVEQVEQPLSILMAEIERNEMEARKAEQNAIRQAILAELQGGAKETK
jgi:hypothetical protein